MEEIVCVGKSRIAFLERERVIFMLKKVNFDVANVCTGIEPSEKERAVIMAMDTREEKADFIHSEKYEVLKRSIEEGGRYRLHPVYNTYFADLETGKVYSIRERNIAELRPTLYPNGYGYLTLMGKKRVYVHRFVMECFLGESINMHYAERVTHHCEYKEFCKDSLYNLRLISRSENGLKRYNHKRYVHKHYVAYRIYRDGVLIHDNVPSQMEVARILGVDSSAVVHHLNGNLETIRGCVVVGVFADDEK